MNGSTASILYQMGILTEQGRNTLIRLDRSDRKLDHLAADIAALQKRTAGIPRMEKLLKRCLTFASPVALVAATHNPEPLFTALLSALGGSH